MALQKIDALLAFLESNQNYTWWDCNGSWQYALNGADVVEYQNIDPNADAVSGNTEYQTYNYGMKWLFKNQANKDLFDANPAPYIPVYGGIVAFTYLSVSYGLSLVTGCSGSEG